VYAPTSTDVKVVPEDPGAPRTPPPPGGAMATSQRTPTAPVATAVNVTVLPAGAVCAAGHVTVGPQAIPSSAAPLQLSSTPLHTSAVGSACPAQAPHALPTPPMPAAQACVPGRHVPTDCVPGGPS
jgi:hypothetical protein